MKRRQAIGSKADTVGMRRFDAPARPLRSVDGREPSGSD